MKTSFRIGLAALLFAATAHAADQSWLGKIDCDCGVSPAGVKPGAAECADACAKGAAKYVFIARGKTYQIANPEFPGLADNSGSLAKVTGTLSGDALTVTRIDAGKKTATAPKK
jgi:hypothetical protein